MSNITVNSADALNLAIKSAQAGDVIMLAPGVYSGVSIDGIKIEGSISIQSADASNLAVLTDFNISNSSGINLKNLELSNAGSAKDWGWQIAGSKDIHLEGLDVHGTLDGDPQNDHQGIRISFSDNVSISNSEFHELYRAIAESDSKNITIKDNEFHDIARTGVMNANSQGVVISGNRFTDFYPKPGDHMDAISFHQMGETNTASDILISGNLITRGDGEKTQGIFFRDTTGESAFHNIKIYDNLIVGMGSNGIYVNGAEDVDLKGNTVISYEGKENISWILLQNTIGSNVANNEASIISYFESAGNVGLTELGNVIISAVQDSGAAVVEAWLKLHVGMTEPGVQLPEEPATPAPAPPEPTPEPAPAPPLQGGGDVADGDPGTGGEVGETFVGRSSADTLVGTDRDDTLDGRGGEDVLFGGAGHDTYYVPNSQASIVEKPGEGVDTVIARGTHTLSANMENLVIAEAKNGWSGFGNEENNVLTGNSGSNLLDGVAGNDTLVGNAGNDTLAGGAGNDLLTGGVGNDMFRFTMGGGRDVVTDFGAGGGQDSIDISPYLRAGIGYSIADVGENTVLSFANGDEITLIGVPSHGLNSIWYGFTS
ncbi:calcium-binding protein [Phenylobacterium koreense]|uniref:Ca2+-binding RTX toxin-like protein n=1 Tax=Phenylobacterium koreense TaxID=266125 RepID=A0ABV2EM34_9CAUL